MKYFGYKTKYWKGIVSYGKIKDSNNLREKDRFTLREGNSTPNLEEGGDEYNCVCACVYIYVMSFSC